MEGRIELSLIHICKYRRNNPIPSDGRVARGGSPIPDEATSYERLYDIVEVLDEIAEETGRTVAQLSLIHILNLSA